MIVYTSRFLLRTDLMIESDSRRVPVKTAPFHAGIAVRLNKINDLRKEFRTKPAVPVFLAQIHILQMYPGLCGKGTEHRIINGVPHRLLLVFRNQRRCDFLLEKPRMQRLLRGRHVLRPFLIGRQSLNQRIQQRNILFICLAHRKCFTHVPLSPFL